MLRASNLTLKRENPKKGKVWRMRFLFPKFTDNKQQILPHFTRFSWSWSFQEKKWVEFHKCGAKNNIWMPERFLFPAESQINKNGENEKGWGKRQWNRNVDDSIWRYFWEGNVSSFATEWKSDIFFRSCFHLQTENKQTEPKFWMIFLNCFVCSALFPRFSILILIRLNIVDTRYRTLIFDFVVCF